MVEPFDTSMPQITLALMLSAATTSLRSSDFLAVYVDNEGHHAYAILSGNTGVPNARNSQSLPRFLIIIICFAARCTLSVVYVLNVAAWTGPGPRSEVRECG